MNPLKRLMSWWRGPTDTETLESEAESQRLQTSRDTIKISQNAAAKGTSGSLIDAPTPYMLDPGHEESRKPR